MSATVTLNDKTFQLSIPHEQLIKAISRVGSQISHDYADKECPLFLGVLNGAFMFMGELMQHIDLNCEVSFIKMASYSGTASTGKVQELIGLSKSIGVVTSSLWKILWIQVAVLIICLNC